MSASGRPTEPLRRSRSSGASTQSRPATSVRPYMLKSRTSGSTRRRRAMVSSPRWSPRAHPEAQRRRRLHLVAERLDDAHEVRRGAAEAGAAGFGHLGQQAVAEEEAAPPDRAAAVGHEREEVADAAREVGRRVDEDAVVGRQAQHAGDTGRVAADGAQRVADALGHAGRARREHDHGELVGRHGGRARGQRLLGQLGRHGAQAQRTVGARRRSRGRRRLARRSRRAPGAPALAGGRLR